MKENKPMRPAEAPPSQLTVRELIAPFFRQKKALILAFVSVLSLLLLYFWISGPAYSSHMAILVNRERLDPLVSTEATTQMIANNTAVAPEEVNSEIELLTSRDVLEKVAIANGLDQPSTGFSLGKLLHPNQTREDRLARAVKSLAKSIKTSVTTKTNVIEVTFSSGNPALAYGVLNSLGNFYAAKHVEVHRPAGSYEFFARETQRYQDDLNQAEARLRAFSQDSGVAAPDVQRSNLALQLANSVGLQHLAEQAIAADIERSRSDQKQLEATPARLSTVQTSAATSVLLDNLNATLLAAETKRTQLTLKYEPTYPLVKEADAEILQTRAAIAQAQNSRYVTDTTDRDPTYELLREDSARTQSDLAAQRANLAATKRSIQTLQAEMVTLDQQAIAQGDLIREAKADENNYLLYLGKREQERTTDALDSTRISNVAIAVPPAIPVLPILSWPNQVLLSLICALLMSMAIAYTLDYMDSSFHTPAQVIDILGIPVVVGVPRKTA